MFKEVESNFSVMSKKLDGIYEILNKEFFENKLEPVTVRIVPNAEKRMHINLDKEIMSSKDSTRQIIMDVSSKALNSSMPNICAGMLHEMVHLYNFMNDVKDTSNNNVYHNKRFKEEALRRGLNVARDGHYGWNITSPQEGVYDLCRKRGIDDFDVYEYSNFGGIKPRTRTSSTRAYVCYGCGQSFRATKRIYARCGICGTPFEECLPGVSAREALTKEERENKFYNLKAN